MTSEPHHHEHEVPLEGKNPIKCITSSPSPSPPLPALIFTHGAGGNLHSDGILNFRTGFARHSPITCFQGSMNLPSRVKMFDAVISHQEVPITAVGGRSMGARAAVMAAKERPEIKFLVLVSYPLHTGKGDVRDEILMEIDEEVKVLFVIGDRDSMCDLGRLEEVRAKMKARTWLVKVEGADHGMTVKPKVGTKAVGELTGKVVADWLGMEEGLEVKSKSSRIWWDEEEEGEKRSGWEEGPPAEEPLKKDQKVKKDVSEKSRKITKKPRGSNEETEQEEAGEESETDMKRRSKRARKTSTVNEEAKKPARKRRKV